METIRIENVGELIVTSDQAVATRLLWLDDDREWLELQRELLRKYSHLIVDIATTTEDASRKLRAASYDVVLADVLLMQLGGVASGMPGDQWLLEHASELSRVVVKAALTARPDLIRDHGALERQGVRIVQKSEPGEQELYAEIERLAESNWKEAAAAMVSAVLGSVGSGKTPSVPQPHGEDIAAACASLFAEWLATRDQGSMQDVWISGRMWSAVELESEVRHKTAVGERLVAMFIRHLRGRIGLSLESPPRKSPTQA